MGKGTPATPGRAMIVGPWWPWPKPTPTAAKRKKKRGLGKAARTEGQKVVSSGSRSGQLSSSVRYLGTFVGGALSRRA